MAINRDAETEARLYLKRGYAFSRAHSRLCAWAERRYGAHGACISGCHRAHFPDALKHRLRGIAQHVTLSLDLSRMYWRESGRQIGTWYRERNAVIAEYGRGFYG